jgi:hypothetical protein
MPDNSKLELIVEVDVNKANASIKSVNTGLSSMEQAATQAARGASQGIDGMTASMVKGATAGNLLADSIKKALDWAKEWTIGRRRRVPASRSRRQGRARRLPESGLRRWT